MPTLDWIGKSKVVTALTRTESIRKITAVRI